MQFVAVFLLALLVFQPKPLVTLQPGASTNAVSVLDHSVCVDVVFRTTLSPAVGNSRTTLLFDVDGDGALDVFIGAFQEADVVYLNDGTGSFEVLDSGSLSSVGPTFDAAAADLDGDSQVDVFVANANGERNVLHRNLGLRRGFEAVDGGSLTHEERGSYGVACADLDLDGDQDVVVANRRADNELHLNDGSGVFSLVATDPLSSEGGNSRDVICGDVDGDGDDDVLIANWGENPHALYINQGGIQEGQVGRFERDDMSELARAFGNTSGGALGDLDDDGDLDLAFSNRKGGRNSVWINAGLGVFVEKADALPSDDGGDSTAVEIIDLNRDGVRDMLVLNRNGAPYLYLNDGTVRFSLCTDVPLGEEVLAASACAWGDLRGDGGLDLLVVDLLGSDQLLTLGSAGN